MRLAEVHTYESPQLFDSAETINHGRILHEVQGLTCAGLVVAVLSIHQR